MPGYVDVQLLLTVFRRKGYWIPEGTLRRWAASAAQQRASDGRMLYRIADIAPKAEAWAARQDRRRGQAAA